MYKECEALIQGNNTTGFTVVTELLPRKPALQYSDEDYIKEPTNRGGYFPTPGSENPSKQSVTGQGHGQAEFAEGMSLKEDGDVEMGGVPSTRKHGREEITNGVGKDGTVQPKKKRKTKQPTGTAKSPPPTATPKTMATPEVEMAIGEEEVATPMEEMRITNGESVGTQLDIIEIPPSARSTISSHTKIYHCAWNPCYGTLLATGGPGVPVQVWRMGSGELQTIITATYPNGTRTGAINSLEWKSDGSGIATGRQDGLITLWTPSGDAKFNVGEKCGAIIYFRWNPTKTMFVTLHLQNILNVWDAMTGERILTQEADYVNVVWTGKESVACSSDTGDITIATVSTEGFKPQTILRHHTSEVAHLSWDEETDRLASAEASKIAIWKGNSSKAPDWSFETAGDVTALAWQPLKREAPLLNGAVNGTASVMAGGKSRLLAASLNGVGIFIWDVVSHTCLQQLHIGNRYPQAFAFSPGGRFIAAGLDRTTFIWDVEDGILKAAHDGRLQRENEPITNGNGISGMDDSAVEVYETQVVLKWNCSGDRVATLWGTEVTS
jgi:WD40 repeat protein